MTAEFTLDTARYAGDASEGRWASVQWGRHYGRILFAGLFVLPVLLAAIYFGLAASDRYVSETRFIVRSVERPAAQGAAAYLQSVGITRANDEAFAMQDFVRSRDLMTMIGRKFDLRSIWGREDADWISRFGGLTGRTSEEALFERFREARSGREEPRDGDHDAHRRQLRSGNIARHCPDHSRGRRRKDQPAQCPRQSRFAGRG